MTQTKVSAFIAKASERHFSTLIASVAFIVVASTFIWTTFFSPQQERTPVFTNTAAISTVDKPLVNHSKTTTPQKESSKKVPALPTLAQRQEKVAKPIAKKQPKASHKKQQVTLGKGKLFVQVGAFKEIVHARVSYEKMRKKYKRARIMPKDDYYAIWVGPVATRAEAERLQKHIYKRDKIKGFITSEK